MSSTSDSEEESNKPQRRRKLKQKTNRIASDETDSDDNVKPVTSNKHKRKVHSSDSDTRQDSNVVFVNVKYDSNEEEDDISWTEESVSIDLLKHVP